MTETPEFYSKAVVDEMFGYLAEMHAISLGMMMGQYIHDGTMTEEVAAYRLRQAAETASCEVVAANFKRILNQIETGLGPRLEVIEGGRNDQ